MDSLKLSFMCFEMSFRTFKLDFCTFFCTVTNRDNSPGHGLADGTYNDVDGEFDPPSRPIMQVF